MRILPYNNQLTFAGHEIKIHPFSPISSKVYIQLDKASTKGKIPSVVSEMNGEKIVEKLVPESDNTYYGNIPHWSPINYYITYIGSNGEDTNSSKVYKRDMPNLIRRASMAARNLHRQESVMAIKDGTTVGKVLFYDRLVQKYFPEINEPTILVCQEIDVVINNPNIVGTVITFDGNDRNSHHPMQLKSAVDVSALILDPKIVEQLKELDGKKIELNCYGNEVEFHETDKPSRAMDTRTIEVPKLKPCYEILTSKEYSSDIIGRKAVNLRRLEELKEQGKIDVTIPKSIALPSGWLELFDWGLERNKNKSTARFFREFQQTDKYRELVDALIENGITSEMIMIRSCFNSEDLPNYSAAGIFNSVRTAFPNGLGDNNYAFIYSIWRVANSKDDIYAEYSRLINHISEENIQPGVIIQNRIEPDFKFTIYTNDDKGNVRVNLYSGELANHSDTMHPHIFRYNRKTNCLSYDSIQMTETHVTYDEDENLIDITPVREDLADNKELFRQLEKAIQNALVVEKEFGAPQDIEGGIKDGKVYFWQSRDLVK